MTEHSIIGTRGLNKARLLRGQNTDLGAFPLRCRDRSKTRGNDGEAVLTDMFALQGKTGKSRAWASSRPRASQLLCDVTGPLNGQPSEARAPHSGFSRIHTTPLAFQHRVLAAPQDDQHMHAWPFFNKTREAIFYKLNF